MKLLLLTVFVAVASAIEHPDLEELFAGQEHPPIWYHPCHDVHLRYDKHTDLKAMSGSWHSVAMSAPFSRYHYNTHQIQDVINEYTGCYYLHMNPNTTSHIIHMYEEIDFRKNISDAADVLEMLRPGHPKLDEDDVGAMSFHINYNAYQIFKNDTGHWLAVFHTKKFLVVIDFWFVAEKPTEFAMMYTCSDIPMAHNVTYRADAWAVLSRKKHDLTPEQRREAEILAYLHGIDSPDPLFNVQQDLCKH